MRFCRQLLPRGFLRAALFVWLGTLLQVLELLHAVRVAQGGGQRVGTSAPDNLERQPNGDSPAHAADSLGALLQNVAAQGGAAALELLWLVDPTRSPCPPIRHAMLCVLEALASIASTITGSSSVGEPLQSALRTAQELNFAEAIRPGSPGRRRVPGRSLLVHAVVTATLQHRFNLIMVGGSQRGGVLERPLPATEVEGGGGAALSEQELQSVLSLLWSSDTDERDAAIKATKKTFGPRLLLLHGGGGGGGGTVAFSEGSLLRVWVAAAEALAAEDHPPNVRRLVRLLVRVGFHLRGGSLPASSQPLWNHLRGLCDGSSAVGSEDVHAGALEAMGVMVRLAKTSGGDGGDNYSGSVVDVDLFARSVESAASVDQPVSMRAAAAASLASSSLLLNATVSLSDVHGRRHAPHSVPTFMRLWFVALTLLQDDNERVRLCAARACTAIEGVSSIDAGGDVKDTSAARGGGRVELCAVNLVLSRLAAMAERRQDGGRAAEEFALNLLSVFSSMPGTSPEELVLMGSCPEGSADLDESNNLDEGDGSPIFGREERNQNQEPALFACVAAPYLSRALAALDPLEATFREGVLVGLVQVLDRLAGNLEALTELLRRMPRATWLSGVYQGIIASLAVGTAVLESAVARVSRGRAVGTVVLAAEVARVTTACSGFEAAFGGDERVHPAVSNAVTRALRATQFSA